MSAATDALRRTQLPERVAGAEWQAGVTPGNEKFRPLLDGEPVPFAFAASVRGSWVMCYPAPVAVFDPNKDGGAPLAYRIPAEINAAAADAVGNNGAYRTLRGRVRIVQGE